MRSCSAQLHILLHEYGIDVFIYLLLLLYLDYVIQLCLIYMIRGRVFICFYLLLGPAANKT